MKAKSNKVLPIIFAFVLGIGSLYLGYQEWNNARRLIAGGVITKGDVLEAIDRRSGKLRSHTYYLKVQFAPTNSSDSITEKIEVSESTFNTASATGTVTVHYLPSEPTICSAGENVDVRYSKLLWGTVFVGAGIFLIVFYKQAANEQEAKELIQEHMQPLLKERHDYAPVQASGFRHLDLAFYDQSQRQLEALGFKLLGDLENLTLKANPRIFLRMMLNPETNAMAAMYHFKPGWMLRVLGAKDAKVTDIENAFTDGTFVCTSNATKAGALNSPPQISVLYMAAATSIQMLAQVHANRVAQHLAARPSESVKAVSSLDELLQTQDQMQKIKAAYRQNNGLTKEELERIANA